MPGITSSHGTTVSFNGVSLGYLRGFDIQSSAATVPVTSVNSTIIGTGANTRVLAQLDCLSIDPHTVSITFYGAPSFTNNDRGLKATLSFSGGGTSFSGQAVLLNVSHSGSVGQYATGSATFQLTGS